MLFSIFLDKNVEHNTNNNRIDEKEIFVDVDGCKYTIK